MIILYSVLDNKKASKNLFAGHYIQSWRKFKAFQGLPLKCKDFQDCANLVKVVPQIDVSLFQV